MSIDCDIMHPQKPMGSVSDHLTHGERCTIGFILLCKVIAILKNLNMT
jgi:hypothetical protein